MSNRRSIMLLLAGIVLLVSAHFAVDCSRIAPGGMTNRRVLLDDSETVTRIVVARRGEQQTVLVYTNDAWRLTAPFPGSADEQTVKRLLDVLTFTPVIDSFTDA